MHVQHVVRLGVELSDERAVQLRHRTPSQTEYSETFYFFCFSRAFVCLTDHCCALHFFFRVSVRRWLVRFDCVFVVAIAIQRRAAEIGVLKIVNLPRDAQSLF
jgi:hypothetical protein